MNFKKILITNFLLIFCLTTYSQRKSDGSLVTDDEKRDNLYLFTHGQIDMYYRMPDRLCHSYMEIKSDDGRNILYWASSGYASGRGTRLKKEPGSFFLNTAPDVMKVHGFAKDSNAFNNCGSYTDDYENTKEFYPRYNGDDFRTPFVENAKRISFGGRIYKIVRMQVGNFTIRISPLHTIESYSKIRNTNGRKLPNIFLPTDDDVSFFGKPGFKFNYIYQLVYRTNNYAPWTKVSRYKHQERYDGHKYHLNAKDLFNNIEEMIGKNVMFRMATYSHGKLVSWSKTISLRVIPSAPKIVNAKHIPSNCSYEKDKVIITLDRELASGEVLKLAITDTTTGEAIANGNGEGKDITLRGETFKGKTVEIDGINVRDKTNEMYVETYGWFEQSGEKIQTFTDGKHNYFKFNVRSVPPLNLKSRDISVFNNVYCHGGKDGAIRIKNITGGMAQLDNLYDSFKYKYSYKKDSLSYSNWVEFKGNKVTINNLSAGTYKVRIRDGNRCQIRNDINKEKEFTVVVNESAIEPVSLFKPETKVSTPSNYNGKDGYISVVVKGGVPKKDGSYNFTWKKGNTIIKNGTNNYKVTTANDSNGYLIKLGNLDAGTYTLNITDANYSKASSKKNNCAIINKTFVIKQPVGITYTESNVNCYGGDDGYINITANGGKPPYEYAFEKDKKWLPFTSGNKTTITGLVEGNYVIKVRDSEGTHAIKNRKIYTPNISISQPKHAFGIVYKKSEPAKGYGRADGKITLQVAGGTPNKNDGTYIYEIREDSPTGNIVTTNITTSVKRDVFTIIANKLPSKNYYVTVKDINYDSSNSKKANCGFISKKIFVDQPDKLQIQHQLVKGISCNQSNGGEFTDNNNNKIPDNAEDGLVEITVTGGVKGTGYNYKWYFNNKPISLGDNTIIDKARHGLYRVIVTDKYQNKETLDIRVIEPPKLTVNIDGRIKNCNIPKSGYAKANVKGGTGKYKYFWNDVNGTSIIDNVSNGTYTVIVEDEKKCRVKDDIVLGNNPKVTYNSKTTTGFGRSDGELSFTVTQGTPNANGSYDFEIRKGTQTGNLITKNISTTVQQDGSFVVTAKQLYSDKYFITVKDVNFSKALSCSAQNEIFVDEPEKLKISYTQEKEVSCNQGNGGTLIDKDGNGYPDNAEDGILKIAVTGGVKDTNGYNYKWYFNDKPIQLKNDTIIDNARFGKYKTVVTDKYQNIDSLTINVVEPAKLKASIFGKIEDCSNPTSAYAEITASGGTGAYSYLWNNDKTTAKISNIPNSGTYTVFIKDAKKCTIKRSVTLGDDPIITSTSLKTTGYKRSDGAILFNVSGGKPKNDGTYFFEIRKGTPTGNIVKDNIKTSVTNDGFSVTVNKLPSDNYYVTVKDAYYTSATSCEVKETIFVEQPDELKMTYKQTKAVSCNQKNGGDVIDDDNNGIPDNAEDGVIEVSTTGGTKEYIYQWYYNNTLMQSKKGSMIDDAKHGTYKVVVTDKYTNIDSVQISVIEPPKLTMNLFGKIKDCSIPNSRVAWTEAQGGTGVYTYSWSNGKNTQKIENITNGKYFVVVKDEKKCSIEGSVLVGKNPILVDNVVIKNPSCYGSTDGEISVTISGGKNTPTLLWSNNQTSPTIKNLKAGTYKLTLSDGTNCGTVVKEYVIENPKKLTVDLGEDITLCSGDSVTYDVKIDDEKAVYEWKDSDNKIISNDAKVTLKEKGTYTVKITSSKGCTASDSVQIYKSSKVLDVDFLMTTHAYIEGNVKAVNISKGESDSLKWILPKEDIKVVKKTNDYVELTFTKTGTYKIGLTAYLGKCKKTIYKTIIVENNLSGVDINENDKKAIIEKFTVYPNPNKGEFKVDVELRKKSDVKLYIVDMISRKLFLPIKKNAVLKTSFDFTDSMVTGNYIVVIEVQGEIMYKKMIVN